MFSGGSFQVMVNRCLEVRNVADGVLGVAGEAGNVVASALETNQ